MSNDLPLFRWRPQCKLIAFPMANRIGRIRDVAGKLMTKTTDRHAEHYRSQVTEALVYQLEKIGLSETEIVEQVGAFWTEVEKELLRFTYEKCS